MKKRRENEKKARREEIVQAALKIFAAKGYEAATLDEIAEAADFGKGTLYNYFPTKEDLFVALIQEGVAAFHKHIDVSLKGVSSGMERLEKYIDASFEYFASHEEFLKIYMLHLMPSQAATPVLRARLKKIWQSRLKGLIKILVQGMDEGSIRREADAEALAVILKWAINSQYYLLVTSKRDVAACRQLLKAQFLQGVSVRLSGRSEESARAILERRIGEWTAAWKARNLEGLLDLISEDAVFLAPGAPPVSGKAAVEKLFRTLWANFKEHQQNFVIHEAWQEGDSLFGWGEDSATIVLSNKLEPVHYSGHGVMVLKRDPDGSWRFARGINNMIRKPL